MTVIGYLLPIALGLGLMGLAAFFWSLNSGQFDDLDGAALRILIDDEEDEDKDKSEDEDEDKGEGTDSADVEDDSKTQS